MLLCKWQADIALQIVQHFHLKLKNLSNKTLHLALLKLGPIALTSLEKATKLGSINTWHLSVYSPDT